MTHEEGEHLAFSEQGRMRRVQSLWAEPRIPVCCYSLGISLALSVWSCLCCAKPAAALPAKVYPARCGCFCLPSALAQIKLTAPPADRNRASSTERTWPLDGISSKSEQWNEKMPKSLFLCISYILNSFEIQQKSCKLWCQRHRLAAASSS